MLCQIELRGNGVGSERHLPHVNLRPMFGGALQPLENRLDVLEVMTPLLFLNPFDPELYTGTWSYLTTGAGTWINTHITRHLYSLFI